MCHLPIVCGNPKVRPATFTRFVLPFAYNLKHLKEESLSEHPHHYEVGHSASGEANLKWRKNYFTEETRQALFKRATWLLLKETVNGEDSAARGSDSPKPMDASRKFSIKISDGRTCEMVMSAPQIVLFELPSVAELNHRREAHLLQIGFLVVETHFPEPNCWIQPTLDDLLRFNELFRYYDEPFNNHSRQVDKMLGKCAIHKLTYGKSEDNDSVYRRWSKLLEFPLVHEGKVYEIVSDDWDIYADNRLFVWTCAIVYGGGGILK